VKQRKPTKTWQRTRLRNLLRHKSGSYYARAFAGGKEVWKSLKRSLKFLEKNVRLFSVKPFTVVFYGLKNFDCKTTQFCATK